MFDRFVSHIAGVTIVAILSTAALGGPMEDLVAADEAFSAMSVAQGSDAAFLAYIAEDVRLFGTGDEPPMIGKAAAQAHYATRKQNGPRTTTLSWTPNNAEVSSDGKLGYTDGRWLFEGKNSKHVPIHITGHYVTVWRKAPSGEWKVIADMGTTDPSPAAQ